MVNVPHDQGQNWEKITNNVRNTVLERISKVLEVDIKSLIETEDILTPPEIQSRHQVWEGHFTALVLTIAWQRF